MIHLSAMKRYFLLLYVVLAFLMLWSCKSPAAPDDIEIPQEVNLHFNVYNHTQGKIGEYTQAAKTGDTITIKINEIGINQGQNMGVRFSLSISGVDASRIVVRGPLNNCKYVAFERDGDVTFTVGKTLNQEFNSVYSIFLMNSGNNTDYNLIDVFIDQGFGKLRFGPNISYYRGIDTVEGPEELIIEAVRQLNQAIDFPWLKYGKITKSETTGDFRIFYDDITHGVGSHGLDSEGYFARVNPTKGNGVNQLRVWLAEIFELNTMATDLGGRDTGPTIADGSTGNLNEIGKDLWAYVFVKDKRKIGL